MLSFKRQFLMSAFRFADVAVMAIAVTVALGTLLLAAVTLAFRISAIDRVFLTAFFSLTLPATLIMRSTLRFVLGGIRKKGRNLRNAVIVGCGPRGAWIGKQL